MAIGKDTLLNIMAMEAAANSVDTNKADGKPTVDISNEFMKSFDESISLYDQTLDSLESLIKGNGFTDDFGVCSDSYNMIYITPKNIASYIDYLFKAISNHLIDCSIVDMEKFAVEMAKRFIVENSGIVMDRDNIFANGKYSDPRTETMMDLLTQAENSMFSRCVCSKYDMEQRAKSMKDDFDKINGLHFAPTMKAVVKALPSTITEAMRDGVKNGYACCNCEVVMRYIEAFILFAVSLNTVLLHQMISYVEPMSTFVRKEASKYKTESYNETAFNGYIMECSILKTNSMNIRSRIPFDCNMRNIVLQDVTPNFKDTKSALHFMLKDNRSPIHALLIQYSSNKTMPVLSACVPAMQLFKPYFDEHFESGLAEEYKKVGFLTDVNWLDKIAYGNQFMDGNYRMDAAGNENRHPIVEVLCTLHKMYCGCKLKTNEELADNILNIAGLMHHIIDAQSYAIQNRQLVMDILAVLGDCFTRCTLRLYHNNCNVLVFSDDMDDTMAPGYSYCEQFVMEADGAQQPTVEVQGAPSTQQKTGVISKLISMFKRFIKWIEEKLSNVPVIFNKINNAKIAYIKGHSKLNEEVGTAIGNGSFSAKLGNFPIYKIPARAMLDKSTAVKSVLDEFVRDKTKEIDPKEIKAKIYPGDETTAQKIANIGNDEQESKMIRNFILFSTPEPDPAQSYVNGNMSADQWKNMVDDLINSQKLIDESCKAMAKSLKDAMADLEKLARDEERQQQQANNNQQNGQQQQTQPTNRADQLFKILEGIVKNYQMNAVNTLTKQFFGTYYDTYKKIIDAYQAQSKSKNTGGEQQQPAAQPQAQTPNEGQQPVTQ